MNQSSAVVMQTAREPSALRHPQSHMLFKMMQLNQKEDFTTLYSQVQDLRWNNAWVSSAKLYPQHRNSVSTGQHLN